MASTTPHQELPDEPQARGPQGEAQAEFVSPRDALREQEVGDIRGSDHQNERDDDEHRDKGTLKTLP